jgi:hypothetical protein
VTTKTDPATIIEKVSEDKVKDAAAAIDSGIDTPDPVEFVRDQQ